MNGDAVTKRDPGKWLINFAERSEAEAAQYEVPFQHVLAKVRAQRLSTGSPAEKRDWWKLARRAPALFAALQGLPRYLATPEVSKHRVFVWMLATTIPDKNLVAISRADDTAFGVLQSRIHAVWALRLGTDLVDRPRYTSSTTFRTFPFPHGLTPDLLPEAYTNPNAAAISAAAVTLNALRDAWLNPPQWVDHVPEVIPGYPDRLVPKPEYAAEIKKRTMTKLYNARPAWFVNACHDLDQAVAKAYGWDDYTPAMTDEEVLRRLLALNLERTAK
jgi:hypothetical protein